MTPPGAATPAQSHVHNRDDETFFVLDGELRVLAGEEDQTAGPAEAGEPARALTLPRGPATTDRAREITGLSRTGSAPIWLSCDTQHK